MSAAPVTSSTRHHRVAGEDVPRWIAVAAALAGTLSAVAAVWLSMASQHAARHGEDFARAVAPAAAIAPQGAHASPEAPATPRSAPAAAPAAPGGASAVSAAVPAGTGAGASPSTSTRPAAGSAGPNVPPAASVPGSPVAAYARVESPRPARECPPSATMLFAFDSARPSTGDFGGDGGALLDWLRAHPGARLAVQGHADAVGTDQHNLILSYQRARAASAALARAGVDPARVALSAAGSHALIEGIPAQAKENRRAVVSVKGYEDCETKQR